MSVIICPLSSCQKWTNVLFDLMDILLETLIYINIILFTALIMVKRKLKKSPPSTTTIEVMHDFAANQRKFSLPVTYSSPGLLTAGQQDSPTTSRRSDYVINELIQSELSYVQELEEILEHYVENLNSPEMQQIIPGDLFGNESVLFGNIDDIHQFHKETFLPELNRAISGDSVEPMKTVAKCFICRSRDFTYLYTIYCQSKWRSDVLREEIGGDNCEYFQVKC